MPPARMEPGSVELALATRRAVFDPRRRMVGRRVQSWLVVALGGLTLFSSPFAAVGAVQAVMIPLVGAIAIFVGLGGVDRALSEQRRYDQHVKPLPRARLRLAGK